MKVSVSGQSGQVDSVTNQFHKEHEAIGAAFCSDDVAADNTDAKSIGTSFMQNNDVDAIGVSLSGWGKKSLKLYFVLGMNYRP